MSAQVYRNMPSHTSSSRGAAWTDGRWFVHCEEHGYVGEGYAAWFGNPETAQRAADIHNGRMHGEPA